MKTAFTMIELIFVIVILGLLSAVAIPKLLATKNDAQIVSEITNAKQVIQNAQSEFLSQTSFSVYPSSKCFSFVGKSDGNFTVKFINSSTTLCKELLKSPLNKNIVASYSMGGTKIKF